MVGCALIGGVAAVSRLLAHPFTITAKMLEFVVQLPANLPPVVGCQTIPMRVGGPQPWEKIRLRRTGNRMHCYPFS